MEKANMIYLAWRRVFTFEWRNRNNLTFSYLASDPVVIKIYLLDVKRKEKGKEKTRSIKSIDFYMRIFCNVFGTFQLFCIVLY